MHIAKGIGGGRKDQEVNKYKFKAGAELDAETSCCRTSSEEKLISSCLVMLALIQTQYIKRI